MIRWNIAGHDWHRGEHRGTRGDAAGLTLQAGRTAGVWCHRLDGVMADSTRFVASLGPAPWPRGTRVALSVRCTRGGNWSQWSSLGVFGDRSERVPRSDADPGVDDDLWRLAEPARTIDIRLALHAADDRAVPVIRSLTLVGWRPTARSPVSAVRSRVWGQTLDVRARSQRTLPGDLPDRGCSPTSLAMVLDYWGCDVEPQIVAEAVQDRRTTGYGNWSFNVAFAAEYGLVAEVVKLDDLTELERIVERRIPVIISHRYAAGQLSNTPLEHTDGHLLVVCGFTGNGDIVVRDPAADPRAGQSVERVYRRAELHRSWLQNACGIAYVISPPDRKVAW